MITILSSTISHPAPSRARLASLAAGVLALAIASAANAQQSFKTAEDAAEALVSAVRSGDRKGVLTVLGRDGADIVSSGDAVADAAARKRVLEAYDAKHRIVAEGSDKAVLIVGDEDWPLPIPLVRKDGIWTLDALCELVPQTVGAELRNPVPQRSAAEVDALMGSINPMFW